MTKSENTETLKSYIIACCADGKVSAQEYEYLKKESKRFRLSENKLKKEIHIALLNMGMDKKEKNDIKSSVVFFKEALKYDPKNKETLKILNEAVNALSEEDLLDLARTTINGFEIYKTILFEKIKEKGNDYNSKISPDDDNSSENSEKAVEFYSVATEIKPSEQDTIDKLNQLLGNSGFVVMEDEPEKHDDIDIPHFPEIFKNVRLFKKGGMSVIYTAILNDPNSRWHERKIIIKQIKPEKKDETIYNKLFFKEYNILRDLEHENILRIIRKGESENGQYYISEFINGKNLNQLIEENTGLTKKDGKRKRITQILKGLLNGIQGIHEESIIHRDIKPANIMITNTANKVKIIDFGLAKTDVYNDKLKEAGTRPYNSPEQKLHAYKVDNRTDIYSFGVVMLELITGWKEKEYTNKLPYCLPNLKRIIEKCTHEKADNRYNYISEIIEEFSKLEVQNELKLCGEKTIVEIDKEENIKSKPARKAIPDRETKSEYKKPKNLKRIILAILIPLAIVVAGFIVYKFIPIKPNKVSPRSIEFSTASGETKVVEIKSSNGWIVQSDVDWLEVDEGNGVINLKTLTENNTFDSKTGVINVVFDNDVTKLIEVIQLGIFPKLKAKPNKITFENDTVQSVSIEIKSNLTWTAETNADWIDLNKQKGFKNDTLIITSNTFNNSDKRWEGKIKITGVEKSNEENIFISQPGIIILNVENTSVSLVPVIGDNKKIKIVSNTDWEILQIPSWLKVEPAAGSAVDSNVVFIINNENITQQSAELLIRATNNPETSKTIKIIIAKSDKWAFNDLSTYIEEIRGASEAINFDELFKHIDPGCEVYYYINGEKMSSSEDIISFVNRIRFGGTENVVVNTIKYNSQGKITEFCQE